MENLRTCVKCRASPSKDPNVTLHRFPKPGATNSLRCELWAKYCFPNGPYSSTEFQRKLFSQHKMLCNKHFLRTCFVGHKLFRTAVPSVGLDEEISPLKTPIDDQACARQDNIDIDDNPADNNITNEHDNIVDISFGNVRLEPEDYLDIDQEEFVDHFDETIDLSNDGEQIDKDVQVVGEILLQQDKLFHTDFKCNVCHGDIVGYCCLQCADWDMCASCKAKGAHSSHYMLRIPALTTYVDSEPVIAAVREQIQHLLELSKEIKSEIYLKEESDTEERTDNFIPELTDPILVANDRSVPEYVHQDSSTQDNVVLTNNSLTEAMYSDGDMNTTDSSDTFTDLSGLLTKEYRHKSKKLKTEEYDPELTDSIIVTNNRSVPEDLDQDSSTQDITITNISPSKVTDPDSDMYKSGSSDTVNNVIRLLNKDSVVKPRKQVIIKYRKNQNNISQSALRISLQEMSKAHNTKYILVKKLKKIADS